MASIMTNSSALTALQSLASTNKNLEMTQSRISTGFRVASATDNAAYWSIATTMRSDKSSLSVVQDTLGLGAGKVDTAYQAITKSITTIGEIKDKLVSAVGASASDKAKIQTEITALQARTLFSIWSGCQRLPHRIDERSCKYNRASVEGLSL